MNAPIRLGRAFATVGIWTLASRLLGFARDIMIAGFLGSGPVAEAFLIAFSLPNMFRRFFAEGAFNMAFVPMFSKKLEAGDDPVTFARDALSGLATVLIVFTVLAQLLMPWLVLAMASGFAEDGRFEMAVTFGRIAFPYILFISLAALLSGVLNAGGRFVAAAAAPLLLNILFVGAMGLASWLDWPMGLTLAWTVPVAGVAQLALVWQAAARAGFRLVPRMPRMTPDLKRLAIIAAPAALAGGVVQVNLLVGRQVASFFDGAIAWLNYADRLYQLPLGVVGIAIGVVLLPDLSRKLRAGDDDGGQNALSRAAEVSMALALPSAVGLLVVPMPIVSALFERGAFGPDDTAATALALAIYALGLPAFVLQKVLQPLYFAREDTRSPFRYALVSLVVNAVVAIGLAPVIGFYAAALGTTLAAWAMVLLLYRGTRGMGRAASFDRRFRNRIWRILAASLLMGAGLWLAMIVLGPFFGIPGLRYVALSALIVLGAVIYFGAGGPLGAFRLSELKSAMRR
ncbi:murein biosynthesis integral membrane protein MurJ [Brevirhabdus pacifica]|uniref:Probable lipid II flippase MurJ n=1 Tax=Brevirhabdus pacifica TaxID=1267768 RepID=A0A1U7DJT2_9RHOB|nr:murein biosynthesis integral membrane protein MurJ [Brevirhabdus pacifica]APX90242.1 murein biosynthesis integral membrane protein MurJ [Brevirhabdus pacifica]OWU78710.1 multidrug transporter MurJ [Loktanella sp. 22II-4b]PJJ80679.1 putative peptidoglycan lipid II flippase [Brevirhabdus pacifica]